MQGRISVLLAGLALALGGGVAGAALVGNGGGGDQASPAEFSLAAERAAEAEKASRASARHALRAAQRARRIARAARRKSNESLATSTAMLDNVDRALADSSQALITSQQAEQDAATALQAANQVSNRLDSTQVVSDAQAGQVQSNLETGYESLGGPSVTVTVPSSGLIEVWATVQLGESGNSAVAADGAVALYEDGQRVETDPDELCSAGTGLDDILLGGFPLAEGDQVTASTPNGASIFGGCGQFAVDPAPVLLEATPGPHTFELRYAQSGCGCATVPAAFSNRTLRVAPRL
jgi:hypothetical protein